MSVKIIENFLDNEICHEILNRSYSQLDKSFGGSRGFRESFNNLPPIQSIDLKGAEKVLAGCGIDNTKDNVVVVKHVCESLYKMKEAIESEYGKDIVEIQSSLIKMLTGAKNPIHADMYQLDGEEWHGGAGNRSSFKYSAILYLSANGIDFEGGKIIFPKQDVEFEPSAGSIVYFPGDIDHAHGVYRISSGERLAIVAFFRPHE